MVNHRALREDCSRLFLLFFPFLIHSKGGNLLRDEKLRWVEEKSLFFHVGGGCVVFMPSVPRVLF